MNRKNKFSKKKKLSFKILFFKLLEEFFFCSNCDARNLSIQLRNSKNIFRPNFFSLTCAVFPHFGTPFCIFLLNYIYLEIKIA